MVDPIGQLDGVHSTGVRAQDVQHLRLDLPETTAHRKTFPCRHNT